MAVAHIVQSVPKSHALVHNIECECCDWIAIVSFCITTCVHIIQYNLIQIVSEYKKWIQKKVRIVARLAILLFFVIPKVYRKVALYKMYLKFSFLFGLVDPRDTSWMFLKQITD